MHPRRRSTRRNRSSAIHLLCESGSGSSIQYLANTDSGSIQVLYHQSHPRNSRSCLRLGSSVQNGASRPIRIAIHILRNLLGHLTNTLSRCRSANKPAGAASPFSPTAPATATQLRV